MSPDGFGSCHVVKIGWYSVSLQVRLYRTNAAVPTVVFMLATGGMR